MGLRVLFAVGQDLSKKWFSMLCVIGPQVSEFTTYLRVGRFVGLRVDFAVGLDISKNLFRML